MRDKILIALGTLATTICLMFTGLVLLALFWKFQPQDTPYVVLSPEEHSVRALPGGALESHRLFKVNRPVVLTVRRELLQHRDDGADVRVTLATTTVEYQPGVYTIRRVLEVPKGVIGTYDYVTKVCWEQNPIRVNCIDVPTLTITLK